MPFDHHKIEDLADVLREQGHPDADWVDDLRDRLAKDRPVRPSEIETLDRIAFEAGEPAIYWPPHSDLFIHEEELPPPSRRERYHQLIGKLAKQLPSNRICQYVSVLPQTLSGWLHGNHEITGVKRIKVKALAKKQGLNVTDLELSSPFARGLEELFLSGSYKSQNDLAYALWTTGGMVSKYFSDTPCKVSLPLFVNAYALAKEHDPTIQFTKEPIDYANEEVYVVRGKVSLDHTELKKFFREAKTNYKTLAKHLKTPVHSLQKHSAGAVYDRGVTTARIIAFAADKGYDEPLTTPPVPAVIADAFLADHLNY